jgi:hypothetical protein
MKCLITDKTSKKIRHDALSETVRFYSIVFCYVLADKYGFGKFKLHQILKSVTTLAEEINENRIQLDELKEVLNDEYDVIIK